MSTSRREIFFATCSNFIFSFPPHPCSLPCSHLVNRPPYTVRAPPIDGSCIKSFLTIPTRPLPQPTIIADHPQPIPTIHRAHCPTGFFHHPTSLQPNYSPLSLSFTFLETKNTTVPYPSYPNAHLHSSFLLADYEIATTPHLGIRDPHLYSQYVPRASIVRISSRDWRISTRKKEFKHKALRFASSSPPW